MHVVLALILNLVLVVVVMSMIIKFIRGKVENTYISVVTPSQNV